MTNKEKLEAIKAEIKRCGKEAEGEIAYEYSKLMNFIDSLPDEPDWCHHRVDLSNCSEEYRKAYYDGWNNCNLQWQHWLDDNHINVGKRFDYQHATIVNKDFAENPWEAKPTHECNCKYAGCCVNGVRRWCHFIENEIPYDRCNPDCHSYEKAEKEEVNVEPEKVTLKRSTVTVEEPLPFEQENNDVLLYGIEGGKPQEDTVIDKFRSLQHIDDTHKSTCQDWGYAPNLYHFDGAWNITWIHCAEGDSLYGFSAESIEEVVDKAYNWFHSTFCNS